MSESGEALQKQQDPGDAGAARAESSLDAKYVLRSGLQSTVMDGEAVIVDLSSNAYFTLNRTATIVWQTLERNEPLSESIRDLGKEFDVSEETARLDVEALARELLASGLINKKS